MPASPTLPARDPTGTPVARVRGGDWCVLAAEGVRPRRLLRRDVPGTRGAARALSQDTRAARRDESGTARRAPPAGGRLVPPPGHHLRRLQRRPRDRAPVPV